MPKFAARKVHGEGPIMMELKRKMNYIICEHRLELRRIMNEISEATSLALKLENDRHRYASRTTAQIKECDKNRVVKICSKCPSEDFTALLKQMQASKTAGKKNTGIMKIRMGTAALSNLQS